MNAWRIKQYSIIIITAASKHPKQFMGSLLHMYLDFRHLISIILVEKSTIYSPCLLVIAKH